MLVLKLRGKINALLKCKILAKTVGFGFFSVYLKLTPALYVLLFLNACYEVSDLFLLEW